MTPAWLKKWVAGWRRALQGRDGFEIDRSLIELALSLTREEWNARARTIAQSQGGYVHDACGADGGAAIALEHDVFGPLWIRPRFVHGSALPAAVEIVVSALPGAAVDGPRRMDPAARRADTRA